MKKTFALTLLLLAATTFSISPLLHAQDDSTPKKNPWQRIELRDGTIVKGRITDFSEGVHTIETADGTLQLPDFKIQTIDPWPEYPRPTPEEKALHAKLRADLIQAQNNEKEGKESWQRIELRDGTVVKGRITDFNEGVHMIETPDGTSQEIADFKIETIGDWTEALPPVTLEEKALYAKLRADPILMQDFQEFMQDPLVMDVIEDPAFARAVANYHANHNAAEFKDYPQAQKLIDNPNLLDLIQSMIQKDEEPLPEDE